MLYWRKYKGNIYSFVFEGFDELMVWDESVKIFIGFFHDLVDQSAGQLESHLLDLVVEFSPTYLTVSVAVEMREYIV